MRTPGKFGRRAPKRAPALRLAPLLTGAVPAHPAAADYLAKLNGGWQMLGNDVAGDCVAVTWANVRRLVTGLLTDSGYYPSQDQVWEIYKTQNPSFNPGGSEGDDGPGSSADNGMDIQTLLEYLVSNPGPDGVKAAAFAAVNPRDPDEVKAAIGIFGYVWTGINVLDANMTQFSKNQPWDYVRHSPVDGGHSVITGGYGLSFGSAPDERFITWATETSFTDAFWQHEVEEAWIVIWPEYFGSSAFIQGIDLQQLESDYEQITGESLVVQVTPGLISQLVT